MILITGTNTFERIDMFDSISISSDRSILALIPHATDIDWWLFKRPFSTQAWIMVGITIITILFLLMIPYYWTNNAGGSYGRRIVYSLGWIFFLLIGVHYDGALTMFFTTEVSVPFKTIKEVMRAYDDWKLMMMKGSDVHFIYYVQAGDPDYKEFWNRRMNKPEETVFNTIEAGVKRMQNDRVVLFIPRKSSLKGFLNANPNVSNNIKILEIGGVVTMFLQCFS